MYWLTEEEVKVVEGKNLMTQFESRYRIEFAYEVIRMINGNEIGY